MAQGGSKVPAMKIPVILDTDIGDDIDDTWALAMMLRSPELDVKMVVTDTDNTAYRAKIAAKMLEIAGRTDVSVAVGIRWNDKVAGQGPWVKDYDLAKYPGRVHEDGVDALIGAIMGSPEPVTLVCIGPLPNIGAALDREPRIADRCRFVGMHGSVRKGYNNSDKPSAECNVVNHVRECQKAFKAAWDMTITPLDTCGIVRLKGDKYKAVRDCPDPLIKAVVENYDVWRGGRPDNGQTSILYDTVAVYLAFATELLVMEKLGIRVTDDGFTAIDDKAKVVNVATEWKDLNAYEDFLVARLLGNA